MGQHPLKPFEQRLERPRRTDEECLRAGSQSVRLEFRFGAAGGGQSLRCRDWHGNRSVQSSVLRRRIRSSASNPRSVCVSRAGIIPIAHSQDTAGPMARTVTDAAILLGALVGNGCARFCNHGPRPKVFDQLHAVPRQEWSARRASGHRAKVFWLQRSRRQVDERFRLAR